MTKRIFLLLLIFVFTAGLYSCSRKKGDTPVVSDADAQNKQVPLVKVREVYTSSFIEKFKVIGVVKPFATAKVSSEEGGLIMTLNKNKGDYVRRGETIARIKKDVELASYDQQEAQYEIAKMNYEKQEQLFNENATTEIQYLTAKWQMEAALRGLEVLRTRLTKQFVRSPINGVVDEKYMNRGEMSAPGSPILNIIDISTVKISAGIPERYVKEIRHGQNVNITVDVLPGVEFTGKISYIAPALSQQNRTFEIEVLISNRDKVLKPEMNANVELTKIQRNDVVVIPQDLIIDYGEEKYVMVLDIDIARKRLLEIGGREGNNVFILSGLSSGEKIIYEGYQLLADGDKVQVVQ
jgi:RND family efflux transporter MFP subunit